MVVRPLDTSLARYESRPRSSEIDELARDAGVHPELARRLLDLGFLDPEPANGSARRRDGASRLARALRLRRDLGLNYAGALLACQLLDRIEQLEQRLRHYELHHRHRR
jgi:hypothetical protein